MRMDKRLLGCLAWLAISTNLLQGEQGQGPSPKQNLISESGSKVHLTANAPRPLEQVLDVLQQKYGWQVDYEEFDVVEHPPSQTPASPAEVQTRTPSSGAFEVDFAAGPNASPDEETTLTTVVDSYNHSKNPGRFELRKMGEQNFDVVGISAHDRENRPSRQDALLDLAITVPVLQRSASDTVALICEKLAAGSRVNINLGVYPRRLLDYRMVTVGGPASPARTLLSSALASTRRKIYWRLLFDSDSKTYFLNLHSVKSP